MPTAIEDFMKTANEEQKNLLFKLSDTAEQEKKLVNKINRIYGSRKEGIYTEGGAVTVCEDDNDAFFIAFKPKEELKKVREQMKAYMEKAVELGMKHLGLIQRNYEFYVKEPLPK